LGDLKDTWIGGDEVGGGRNWSGGRARAVRRGGGGGSAGWRGRCRGLHAHRQEAHRAAPDVRQEGKTFGRRAGVRDLVPRGGGALGWGRAHASGQGGSHSLHCRV